MLFHSFSLRDHFQLSAGYSLLSSSAAASSTCSCGGERLCTFRPRPYGSQSPVRRAPPPSGRSKSATRKRGSRSRLSIEYSIKKLRGGRPNHEVFVLCGRARVANERPEMYDRVNLPITECRTFRDRRSRNYSPHRLRLLPREPSLLSGSGSDINCDTVLPLKGPIRGEFLNCILVFPFPRCRVWVGAIKRFALKLF